MTGRTGDGLTQVLVPADAPGVSIDADADRRPHPPLLGRCASTTCACPPTRSSATVGAPTQVERQLQLAARDRQRRVGRRDAARLRHDRRVGVRPLLVRPSAGVVPGAQAPLRRHEDVARGEPRDQRRGRGRGRRRSAPTPASSRARRRRTSASTAPSSLQDCVQIHGGIGVTFEHDLHLFLRRLTLEPRAARHAGRAPPARSPTLVEQAEDAA